jgi:hypothetical protein
MALTYNDMNGSPGSDPMGLGAIVLAVGSGPLGVSIASFVAFVASSVRELLVWLLGLSQLAPLVTLASGMACLLLAILVGAYRQFCIHLLSRTLCIEVTDDQGQAKTVPLGTYCPAWLSARHRLSSWLLVAVSSLWGAGVVATTPMLPPTVDPSDTWGFGTVFVVALVSRWILSAVLGRGLAMYCLHQEGRWLDDAG